MAQFKDFGFGFQAAPWAEGEVEADCVPSDGHSLELRTSHALQVRRVLPGGGTASRPADLHSNVQTMEIIRARPDQPTRERILPPGRG